MRLEPCMHACMHAYIYIYIYMCVCVCVCVSSLFPLFSSLFSLFSRFSRFSLYSLCSLCSLSLSLSIYIYIYIYISLSLDISLCIISLSLSIISLALPPGSATRLSSRSRLHSKQHKTIQREGDPRGNSSGNTERLFQGGQCGPNCEGTDFNGHKHIHKPSTATPNEIYIERPNTSLSGPFLGLRMSRSRGREEKLRQKKATMRKKKNH